jgi:hypothetical protein
MLLELLGPNTCSLFLFRLLSIAPSLGVILKARRLLFFSGLLDVTVEFFWVHVSPFYEPCFTKAHGSARVNAECDIDKH